VAQGTSAKIGAKSCRQQIESGVACIPRNRVLYWTQTRQSGFYPLSTFRLYHTEAGFSMRNAGDYMLC